MRMVLMASVGVMATAAVPAIAFAVDYMSADQAAQAMFPDADRFEVRQVSLDAAQMAKLESLGVSARSPRWAVKVAQRGPTTLGYVVIDEVIGKFELITYAVGIGMDGAVKQLEILSYRESHGHEIRLAGWRRQFIGKTSAAPMRNGDDIGNISGATLSCNHVTEGVKRIVTLVEFAKRSGVLL